MGESRDGALHAWKARERGRERERRLLLEHLTERIPEARNLLAAAGCSEAWIVGSVARGDPDAGSDVDLIVRDLDASLRPHVWWDLCELFGREVDVAEMERIPVERLTLLLEGGRRILP